MLQTKHKKSKISEKNSKGFQKTAKIPINPKYPKKTAIDCEKMPNKCWKVQNKIQSTKKYQKIF